MTTAPVSGAPAPLLHSALGSVRLAQDIILGNQPGDTTLAGRVAMHLNDATAAVTSSAQTIEQGALAGAHNLAATLRGDVTHLASISDRVKALFGGATGSDADRTTLGEELGQVGRDIRLAVRHITRTGVRRLTADEQLLGHRTQADTAFDDPAHARLVYDGS